MTAVLCVAIPCFSALAGWVLWIRIQPRVTRAEFEAHAAAIKELREKMNKAQQALLGRGHA